MGNEKLWAAVRRLADVWREIPLVSRFSAQLPRNASSRKNGLPGVLQHIEAAGGRIDSRPLRAVLLAERIADAAQIDLKPVQEEFQIWIRDAVAVEQAHRSMVAWVRSRLPGYPSLPAPHLAPGTAHMAGQGWFELTWEKGERSRGLEAEPGPKHVGYYLASTEHQATFDVVAPQLADALLATGQWQRLARAFDGLDSDARLHLEASRKELLSKLSDTAVSNFEPRLLTRQDDYRREVLKGEIAALSGGAREYAEAFEGALSILQAASDVLGQLVAYGPPVVIESPEDLEFGTDGAETISFTRVQAPILNAGYLLRIGDSMVEEVVCVETIKLSMERGGSLLQKVQGRLLQGTRDW